jgi:murein endopeptidase
MMVATTSLWPFRFLAGLALLAPGILLGSCAAPVIADDGVQAPLASLNYQEPEVLATAVSTDAPSHVYVDISPILSDALKAVDDALRRSTRHVGGWQLLPEEALSYAQILDNGRVVPGPRSVGTVRDGRLIEAVELPAVGDHHSIIERHRARGTRYGSEAMIRAVLNGARSVAQEYPGAVLRVGNISRQRGGAIPWSVSHHAGRDADLAFYTVRANDGTYVEAPDLLHFDDEGRCIERPDLRFDVERNWALVRALLSDPDIQVQWLLISEGLKFLLLNHALGIGEPPELIDRASVVLHQPTDALPHNDHFHLRVSCTRAERIEGCIDGAPMWAWLDDHQDALLARSLEVRKALRDPRPETRLAALEFLHRIQSPWAPEIALIDGVYDADPAVRKRSLEIASQMPHWSATSFVAAANFIRHPSSTLTERAQAYSILRRGLDPMGVSFALERLLDENVAPREKVYAARTLAHQMTPDLVPVLLEQLAVQPGPVRVEIARVLHRITNKAIDGIDWSSAADHSRATALEQWWRWWEDNRLRDRRDWIQDGFGEQFGLTAGLFESPEVIDALIPLLRTAPEHVAYNAHLIIREHTRRWAPLELDGGNAMYTYWARWWQRNRERLLRRDIPTAWHQ